MLKSSPKAGRNSQQEDDKDFEAFSLAFQFCPALCWDGCRRQREGSAPPLNAGHRVTVPRADSHATVGNLHNLPQHVYLTCKREILILHMGVIST